MFISFNIGRNPFIYLHKLAYDPNYEFNAKVANFNTTDDRKSCQESHST